MFVTDSLDDGSGPPHRRIHTEELKTTLAETVTFKAIFIILNLNDPATIMSDISEYSLCGCSFSLPPLTFSASVVFVVTAGENLSAALTCD